MKRKIISIAVPVAYSVLFGYSGLNKLVNINSFANQMKDIPVLFYLSGVLTWFLPILELGLAVCLLVPFLRVRALVISVLLMCVFTIYLLVLYSGPYLSCGCGGIIENLNPATHLLFNLGFIGLGTLGINYCMQIPRQGETAEAEKL